MKSQIDSLFCSDKGLFSSVMIHNAHNIIHKNSGVINSVYISVVNKNSKILLLCSYCFQGNACHPNGQKALIGDVHKGKVCPGAVMSW